MAIENGPVPMHSQLRQLLRSEILGGAFAPLDKLPSEAELSARHKSAGSRYGTRWATCKARA